NGGVRQGNGTVLEIESFQSLLQFSYLLKSRIPASLQLGRHQAVLRIARFVASGRQARLILPLLDFQPDHVLLFFLLTPQLLGRFQCGRDGVATDSAQNLASHGLIDSQRSERNAPTFPVIEVRATAMIADDGAPHPAVGDM